MLLLLRKGDDNVAADARHTLDTFDLGPVVEAQSRGRRWVVALARIELWSSHTGRHRGDLAGLWVEFPGGGKPRLRAVRWPRLLEYLWVKMDGQPVLVPASTWDRAKPSLLVVPLLVHLQVRFSATRRPAMMYGTTCGLNAAKAALSHHGRCFR